MASLLSRTFRTKSRVPSESSTECLGELLYALAGLRDEALLLWGVEKSLSPAESLHAMERLLTGAPPLTRLITAFTLPTHHSVVKEGLADLRLGCASQSLVSFLNDMPDYEFDLIASDPPQSETEADIIFDRLRQGGFWLLPEDLPEAPSDWLTRRQKLGELRHWPMGVSLPWCLFSRGAAKARRGAMSGKKSATK